MDAILPQLLAVLNGSGPWGVLIGVVVMLAWSWWKNRSGGSAPAPDPNSALLAALLALLKPGPKAPNDPAPAPVIPDEHKRPLLDALLKALGGK